MMDRQKLIGIAIVLLVTTSGCSAFESNNQLQTEQPPLPTIQEETTPISGTYTETYTEIDEKYPPGTSKSGINNVKLLLAAHRQSLLNQGYTRIVQQHFEKNNTTYVIFRKDKLEVDSKQIHTKIKTTNGTFEYYFEREKQYTKYTRTGDGRVTRVNSSLNFSSFERQYTSVTLLRTILIETEVSVDPTSKNDGVVNFSIVSPEYISGTVIILQNGLVKRVHLTNQTSGTSITITFSNVGNTSVKQRKWEATGENATPTKVKTDSTN